MLKTQHILILVALAGTEGVGMQTTAWGTEICMFFTEAKTPHNQLVTDPDQYR